MSLSIGFKAVSRKDARVLILGTLPGAESLKQQQYYAKKQNAFWKIMGELVQAYPGLPYETRLKRLTEHHIALWDVCTAAERQGSLDSAIQSPKPNDFAMFFKTHTKIELVCFNGQAAEKLFTRLVRPTLPNMGSHIPFVVLPSTSPAHAGMRFEQKLQEWRDAIRI